LFLLTGCAQVQPLSGGQKDVIAPQIRAEKTIPVNGSIGFNATKIEMKFDEYILLNKPSENVIVTPSLVGKPKYKVLNKKLTIDLEDVTLEPNTTYVFNFNGAIVDYHEGNDSLYQYVFSTGSYVDSLSIKGKIEDAFTNKPAGDVSVLLYEKYQDSSVYNERAKYFTKSDKNGNYHFSYLGAGQYKLVAIEDENKDLLLTPRSEEKVAILDEWIVLDNGNAEIDKPVRLFEMVDFTNEIKEATYEFPGKLIIENYSKFTKDDIIRSSWNDLIFDSIASDDQQKVFWNAAYGEGKIKFDVVIDGIVDTLTRTMSFDEKFKTELESNISSAFNPFDSIQIQLNVLPESYDLSKVKFYKDTNIIEDGFYIKDNKIMFDGPLEAAEDYKLILDEGAGVSIYDSLSNADTILFATRRAEYYGALKIDLTTEKSGFIELVTDKGDVVYRGIKSSTYLIKHLAPGSYSLRFVIDENSNGVWDTGDVLTRKQPERVSYMEDPVVIRSNWDVEIEWIHE
jgi:uncharacterized protein (DUF2141 family)